MKRAAAVGDAVRFHEAAGAALRERLGEMWKLAPDEITSAEAAARMGRDDEPVDDHRKGRRSDRRAHDRLMGWTHDDPATQMGQPGRNE
jgi:hypothetical protein